MADEATATQEAAETEAHAEEQVDYKALYEKTLKESRKWEQRSKDNAEKAKRLDELTAGEESLEDRIAKLEAENKRLHDEKERAALVAKVASETGIAESLVATLNGNDEDTLMAQAQAIAALKPTGAPIVPEAGKFPQDAGASKTAAEKFGEIVDQFFA